MDYAEKIRTDKGDLPVMASAIKEGTPIPGLTETQKTVGELKQDLINKIGIPFEYKPVSYEWDGYYYIGNDGSKVPVADISYRPCTLTKPIYFAKGTKLRCVSNVWVNGWAISKFNGDGKKYTPLIKSTQGAYKTYTLTIDEPCYLVIRCEGLLDDSRPNFVVEVIRTKSEVDLLKEAVGNNDDFLAPDRSTSSYLNNLYSHSLFPGTEYTSVKNAGTLGKSLDATADYTCELYVDIPKSFAGRFFGGTSSAYILNIAVNNDANRGRVLTFQGLSNIPFKSGRVHIVTIYRGNSKEKIVYVNGIKVAEGILTSLNFPQDTIHGSTIEVFIKRRWKRVLTESEIHLLYNLGYPLKFVMSKDLAKGLESDLNPTGINSEGWTDASDGQLYTFTEDTAIYQRDDTEPLYDLKTLKEKRAADEAKPIIKNIYYPEYEVKKTKRGQHDCTFIGENRIMSFHIDYFREIDTSTWAYTGVKNINFVESTGRILEMKSVDCRYNKLLVGNGRAIKYDETSYDEQGHKLYVFYDYLNWRTGVGGTVTFENCGNYDVIDVTGLGDKIYGFWGQQDDMVFVNSNLFNDVYLIQLGKGTQNMGSGTYAAADANRYNGSYKVIGHWHQDTNYFGGYGAHGGQFYHGNLYLASNETYVCSILKCVLLKDGSMHFDEYRIDKIYNPQNVHPYEHYDPDGMCIKDGKMYIQPLFTRNADDAENYIIADIE